MDKKKVASISLALVLMLGLTGYSIDNANQLANETGADVVNNSQVVSVSSKMEFETYKEKPEIKIYEPYEHVFFIRYKNSNYLNSGTFEIPEGYELLDIKYYNKHVGGGSETCYTDLWLTNKKTVKVEPIYYKRDNTYSYSQPGVVLEMNEDHLIENESSKMSR